MSKGRHVNRDLYMLPTNIFVHTYVPTVSYTHVQQQHTVYTYTNKYIYALILNTPIYFYNSPNTVKYAVSLSTLRPCVQV